MGIVESARTLAESLLAKPLPRRWSHVQAVAAKADSVAPVLVAEDRPVLVAAAWLHDVGYAPAVADTGFHPLDGARWLRSRGWDPRIVSLAANHSCALTEADERGMAEDLAEEFPREESAVTDALWYADMTTGPDGQDFDVPARLAEIRSRYGPDHVVTRFWARAEPEVVAAVRRTERRLAAVGQPM